MDKITNINAAEAHLIAQIKAETEKANKLFAACGEFVPADIEKANSAFDSWMEAVIEAGDMESIEPLSARDTALIKLGQVNETIEKLNETLRMIDDLIIINRSPRDVRKAKAAQKKSQLVAPAGFHPEQQVFIEIS